MCQLHRGDAIRAFAAIGRDANSDDAVGPTTGFGRLAWRPVRPERRRQLPWREPLPASATSAIAGTTEGGQIRYASVSVIWFACDAIGVAVHLRSIAWLPDKNRGGSRSARIVAARIVDSALALFVCFGSQQQRRLRWNDTLHQLWPRHRHSDAKCAQCDPSEHPRMDAGLRTPMSGSMAVMSWTPIVHGRSPAANVPVVVQCHNDTKGLLPAIFATKGSMGLRYRARDA